MGIASDAQRRRTANRGLIRTPLREPVGPLFRGVPIGEIGYTSETDWYEPVEDALRSPPRPLGSGEALYLFSGLLDDPRRDTPIELGDPMRALLEHAYLYQDSWNRFEHRGFWDGTLALWPRSRGRGRTTDAKALMLVLAWSRGVTTTQIAAECRWSRDGLRTSGAVRLAESFWHELADPGPLIDMPHGGRLPRVVAESLRANVSSILVSTSNGGCSAFDAFQAAQRAIARDEDWPADPPVTLPSPDSCSVLGQAVAALRRLSRIAGRDEATLTA